MNRNRRVPQTRPRYGPVVAQPAAQVVKGDPTVRVKGFDIGAEPTIEFEPGAGLGMRSLRATDRVKVTVDATEVMALAQQAQDDAIEALEHCCELVVDDNVTSPPSTVYTDDGVDWVYDDPHR